MKLSDITKMYVGNKSVQRIWLGATMVWPALAKPVVSVSHIPDIVPNFLLSVSWTWPTGATDCWVYVDSVKVAEISTAEQGMGYWEGGSFGYNTTHSVYVKAFVFPSGGQEPKASSKSDTVTYTIADPAYTGQTFVIKLVASKDNIFGWTTGDGVKLYACFQGNNWPSAEHRAAYLAKYDNMSNPSLGFYLPFEYSVGGSTATSEIDTFLGPVMMDNVNVYEDDLTDISTGVSTHYKNIMLLDGEFLPSTVFDWTPGKPLVSAYDYWIINGTTYRFYIENAWGGNGTECPEIL